MRRVSAPPSAFRLVVRSVRRSPWRTAVGLFALVVGTSVAAALLAIVADVGRKIGRELVAYGPNLTVKPRSDALASIGGARLGPLPSAATMPAGDLQAVLRVVAAQAPSAVAPVLAGSASLNGQAVPVIGTIPAAWKALDASLKVREGALPEGPADCALGAALAKRTGSAAGAWLEIAGGRFRVTAILEGGGSSEDSIVMPLGAAQQILRRPGEATAVLASVPGGPDRVEAAARAVEKAAPAVVARPVRPIAEAEGAILGRIELMMALVSALVLAAAVVTVGTTFTAAVLDRRRELALLLALGATRARVARLVVLEAALLGIAGGVLGCVGGAVAASVLGRTIFGSAISIRPEVPPAVVAVSVAVAVAGALLPARRATRLEPALVLKEE